MKKFIEQAGNSLVVGMVLVLVVALLGFAGYKVLNKQAPANKQTQTQPQVQPKPQTSTSTSSNTPEITPNDDGKSTGKVIGQVSCTSLDSQKPCGTSIEYESTATNPASGRYTQPFIVDASGRFSIDLEPGSYTFTPAQKPDYPMFIPALKNPVEVRAGHTTSFNINYHDGTR